MIKYKPPRAAAPRGPRGEAAPQPLQPILAVFCKSPCLHIVTLYLAVSYILDYSFYC